MTKQEIYEELNKVATDLKDYVLVNDEVVVENVDLNDDWFELTDYADDEETFNNYTFEKVNYIDGEVFKKEDDSLINVEFKQPAGCVIRYEIK